MFISRLFSARLRNVQTPGSMRASRASKTMKPPFARSSDPALMWVKSVRQSPERSTSRSMVPKRFLKVGAVSMMMGVFSVSELSTRTFTLNSMKRLTGAWGMGNGMACCCCCVLFLFLEDFQIGQDVLLDLVEVAVDLLVGVHVAQAQIRDLLHHGGGAVLVLEGSDLLPDLALDVPRLPHDRIELDAQVDDFLPDRREFLLAELVFLGHGLELLEGHGASFHDRGDVLPREGAHLELHELEILLQQAIVELPDDLLLLLPDRC